MSSLFPSLVDGAALIVAGTLVGNEVAVALVNAQLDRLDDRTYARTVRPLAAAFGRLMPVWYLLTLTLTLAVLVTARAQGTPARWLTGSAAALFAAAIAYTVGALVPINNRIAALNLDDLPREWRADHRRWDARHQFRIAVLLLAFALLVASTFADGAR